jgi:hypothetical protein
VAARLDAAAGGRAVALAAAEVAFLGRDALRLGAARSGAAGVLPDPSR